jgi:hypothetical protein
LPAEAAEALLELATGGTPRLATVPKELTSPFEHPDAQRHFRIMSNVEELGRALDFSWDDRWFRALKALKLLDGKGKLHDIRRGAYGTTKPRRSGGKDVQPLAYALEKEGLIEKPHRNTYWLTERGRRYVEERGG